MSAPTTFADAAPKPCAASLIMTQLTPASSVLKRAVVPEMVKKP